MTDSIDLKRAALQLLNDWQVAGLSHLPPSSELPAEEEVSTESEVADEVASPTVKVEEATVTQDVEAGGLSTSLSSASASPPVSSSEESDMPVASRETNLASLAQKVAACTKCQELSETRTQTVFGVGNPNATVMFIGEAPGADEDATGEPFVGKAGKLLTKIIEACGWSREEIYICNILRCRPPGNRNPTTEEANNCREYLDGQIEIVNPDYIVCWGTIAAQNLLGKTDAIGKLRQTFFEHGRAKVLCTYHPSYLLRNPSAKKPVWEDMKILLNEMGITPPSEKE